MTGLSRRSDSRFVPSPDAFLLDRAVPAIMGIVNVTPDSFHAPSRETDPASAAARAHRLAEEGADVIDLGAESTRPGAEPVPDDEQIARLEPVLRELAGSLDVPISVDTTRSRVARMALDLGASIVNDVSAGTDDPEMLRTVAAHDAAIVLMHRRGPSATMQDDPTYGDVVAEVRDHLVNRAAAAREAGIEASRTAIDPGIGFGKTLEHNLALLKRLDVFVDTGYPVVLGASRKRFLGSILGASDEDRLEGSLAVAAWAARQGVRVVRVHDVGATARLLRTLAAIEGAP